MININKRQANFLRAFERAHGRPETVTRINLLTFMSACGKEKMGPYGHVLRFPAWLTNSGTFSHQRGVYILPWEAYDRWVKANEPTDLWTGTVVQPGHGIVLMSTAELLARARGGAGAQEPKEEDGSGLVGMVSSGG